MGVVYKGFDPHIRRTVALKTIRRELIDDDQAAVLLARFRNEAQAAGQLSHPGIVGVYEWGEVGEIVFLAMEYVAGNSLREYFNRGTRFEGGDAVSIMVQLLDALQLRARAGRVAPRHQAGEPDHHGQRQAEDRGFRHRPHRDLEPHPDRRHHGHARLHGARAVQRPLRRLARRHLLGRRGDVPAADGRSPLHRQPRVDRLQDLSRRAGAPLRGRPRALHHAVRRGNDEGARQESRATATTPRRRSATRCSRPTPRRSAPPYPRIRSSAS